MTIEEKLKNYILAEYKSIREFCMKNNFPYSTVDSIFKRGIMGSSVSLMISICDRLNIDIDKLADGEIVQKSAASRSFSNIAQITTTKIPLLGRIACGKPIYAAEERESYVQVGTDIAADFCLIAQGDSMINARIMDGDVVFCRSQSAVYNGEIAAVIIGDEATLKRVYYYPEKQKLVLQAENPKYEPLVLVGEELADVHIIGKAVAFHSDIR